MYVHEHNVPARTLLTLLELGRVKGERRASREVFSVGLLSSAAERGRGRLAEGGIGSLEGTSVVLVGPKSIDWNTEMSAL